MQLCSWRLAGAGLRLSKRRGCCYSCRAQGGQSTLLRCPSLSSPEGKTSSDQSLPPILQASLADAQRPLHAQFPFALPGQQQQQLQPAAEGPAGGGELALAGPGLANAVGEYNCFLNVIVQCLWYCAEFREQVGGAGLGLMNIFRLSYWGPV